MPDQTNYKDEKVAGNFHPGKLEKYFVKQLEFFVKHSEFFFRLIEKFHKENWLKSNCGKKNMTVNWKKNILSCKKDFQT